MEKNQQHSRSPNLGRHIWLLICKRTEVLRRVQSPIRASCQGTLALRGLDPITTIPYIWVGQMALLALTMHSPLLPSLEQLLDGLQCRKIAISAL